MSNSIELTFTNLTNVQAVQLLDVAAEYGHGNRGVKADPNVVAAPLTGMAATLAGNDIGIQHAAVAPATDTQVDARGVPWISGIHSDNKGQKVNNTWKRRNGTTVEQMEAAEAPYLLTEATAPVPAALAPVAAPVVAAPVVAAPAAMPIPVAPVAAPLTVAQPVSYEMVTAAFGNISKMGLATDTNITQIYAAAGVTDVSVLATDETLRASVMTAIANLIAANS